MSSFALIILVLGLVLSVAFSLLFNRRAFTSLLRGVTKPHGDLTTLEQNYTKLIDSQPRRWQLYYNRGTVRYQQDRYEEAIADYDQAIALNPRAVGAYNNRGYCHSVLGQLDQALEDCDQAIQLDPKQSFAYGSRGHTYFLMGQFEEALKDFYKSAELKPDHKFAIAGQAVAQYRLGDQDMAKFLWQQVLALDPGYANPDKLQTDFHCADAFVEAAREVAAL